MRTTVSPCISALKLQPTPQYAQVVTTECSGWPSSTTVFSISDPVGQACTQAPHETHCDCRNGSSMPAAIFEAKPRPCTVNAKVPCTSSQARTQREHTIQRAESN